MAAEDPLDQRARTASAEMARALQPEPPAFATVRARARHRVLAGSAASILVVVAVVAGILVTRGEPSAPSPGPSTPIDVHLVRSDKPRSKGDAGDIPVAVAADTAFATDLVDQLSRSEAGNFFVSPHSISMALAMTMAGADGETKAQLEQALHVAVPEQAFHQALNALDQALTAPRQRGAGEEDGDPLTLTTANSLWGQAGYPFRQQFLDQLALSYDAGMNIVDFEKAAEASRTAINAWVAEHTDGKITELIGEGVVDELTRLVLVNTITFKGSWAHEFDPPEPGPFTRPDGSEVNAELMAGGTADLAEGDGWRSGSVPYVGGAHLVVIVPDNLAGFELTPAILDAAAADGPEGDITLPAFTVDTQLQLGETLQDLGVTDAFTPGTADLSRMDGSRSLSVSAVIHQATIIVDEKGTEAAAATAVVVTTVSAQPEPEPLVVDRPFLFAIRDDATGAILFAGRVTDPTA